MNSGVSVIIPTYNRRMSLKCAINSVLAQGCVVSEILVCDDGSTDDTRQFIENLSKSVPNLRYVGIKHSGGPALPRNAGIEAARGEWIAFIDSDDKWKPTKLRKQLNYAQKHNLGFVSTNATKVLNGNESTYLSISSDSTNFSFSDLVRSNHIVCSSVLVKKTIINQIGGFPEEDKFIAVEDYITWIKISLNTQMGYISEPLVDYLDNPKAKIRNRWSNSIEQMNVIIPHIFVWYFAHLKLTIRYLSAMIPLVITRLKYN